VLNLLFHFTGLPNEHRDKEQVWEAMRFWDGFLNLL
jgi:hypothetical protein